MPAEELDPAATDETTENARDGGRKRRNGHEPAAVVGLGASAGGIAVLQQFFNDMPGESGLAFVVVMHLSPEHESNLASIIHQRTTMPVTQVSEPVNVQPNHVYVIPPNKQLAFEDGMLRLLEPQQAIGRRVTIDLFFRTLAVAYGQRSVCMILSGTDSDGVIGLKHIRAQGGVTIAQDPKEAEYDSMPLSAISTGMVDWVLPVAEMAPKLMEFVRNETRMQLPPEILEAEEPDAKDREAAGGETVAAETRGAKDEAALREVLTILRRQTGHDFSHYKRATLLRRIARRMQVNSMESIPAYLEFFRQHPAEARELLHDLLIGVTHFFRDRASFAALEANIPQLFAGKQKDDQIRVWAAGCATGEEAYSIAMLLCEYAERLDSPPSIQIFATDVDEQAISDARQGIYPVTIEADVSNERLKRFFAKDHGRYRVRKALREKVLFAAHNLLSDAPFSNLDLVSCRNLLIYLTPKAQQIVFDIFHFSLRAGGLLFIGGAETGSNMHALFSPVDATHRLYVRRSVPRPSWKIPLIPARARDRAAPPSAPRKRSLSPLSFRSMEAAGTETRDSTQAGQKRRSALFGELHLKLLEQYGPPSVVVNQDYDIVHLSEHAGRYLRFGAGEPTANLMKALNPALEMELRTALFRASRTKEASQGAPTLVEFDGTKEVVTISVRPVRAEDIEQGFYLVLFQKETGEPPTPPPAPLSHDAVTRNLESEIDVLKHQLNDTSEQYEAANEELKASNEELQAMNEEMRSATEELETSKEELQSVNEELITVNNELKSSVEELSRANADLTNLMASTDIGTIFLDRQLRVQRFTPSAQKVFNLLPADVGRPISDITHKLAYDGLMGDAEKVLENLTPIEREVRLAGEQWYLVRMAPYRTAEDRIAGVVATFIDITTRKHAEEHLRASEERMRRALDIGTIGIMYFRGDGPITQANDAFLRMSGYSRADLETGKLSWQGLTPEEFMPASLRAVEEFEARGVTTPYQKQYIRKDGSRFWALFAATRIGPEEGIEFIIDISEQKRAEEALRDSEERFRQFAENSTDVFWIADASSRQIDYLNPAYEKMWGEPREMTLGDWRHWMETIHPEDREKAEGVFPEILKGKTSVAYYRITRASDGEMRWIRDTGFPIRNEKREIHRAAGVAQDVTEDRQRAEALHESEERFRLLVEGAREYAIFMVDQSNTIVHWNAGAERIFGWTAEEAIGQSGELIFTPEDREREEEEKEIEIALRNGVASDCRWHMRKDGSRLWVNGVMQRIEDDETGALRGFAKIARDATAQRAAEEKLKASHLQLEQRVKERTADLTATNKKLQQEIERRSRLEQEILQISEREKRRIGQDLHDSLCQELAATAFLLESRAQKVVKKDPAEAKALSEAAQTVNANVGLARDLARGLHPIELSSTGLTNALRELAYRTSHAGKVSCHFVSAKPVRIRDEAVALNLYRIAQEAVTNALKHGKPKNITISLQRSRSRLQLTITDDGEGMPGKKSGKGMGIDIMRYRASAIGGALTVEFNARGGTTVSCVQPA